MFFGVFEQLHFRIGRVLQQRIELKSWILNLLHLGTKMYSLWELLGTSLVASYHFPLTEFSCDLWLRDDSFGLIVYHHLSFSQFSQDTQRLGCVVLCPSDPRRMGWSRVDRLTKSFCDLLTCFRPQFGLTFCNVRSALPFWTTLVVWCVVLQVLMLSDAFKLNEVYCASLVASAHEKVVQRYSFFVCIVLLYVEVIFRVGQVLMFCWCWFIEV